MRNRFPYALLFFSHSFHILPNFRFLSPLHTSSPVSHSFLTSNSLSRFSLIALFSTVSLILLSQSRKINFSAT